jgi:choice-of-anchor C domain-containing protein
MAGIDHSKRPPSLCVTVDRAANECYSRVAPVMISWPLDKSTMFALLLVLAACGSPTASPPAAESKPPAATASAGAGLVNGGFEQGPEVGAFLTLAEGATDIVGWKVNRATIDYIGTHFPSPEGARHVDLDGSPGQGALSQTFTTAPGQKYRLSFQLAGNPEGGPTTKVLQVVVAGQSKNFSHDSSLNWTRETLDFTADAAQTTLEFKSSAESGDSCGPLLDDVVVSPAN